MVFSSVPIYLDPPNNWSNQQSGGGSCDDLNNNHHQMAPPGCETGGGTTSLIKSSSVTTMTDRARIAKIPQPEAALKCPRCDSTNTKFCYFNNYSLTQPRHLCKTCRRYWTRGGSLRNVPVGGGCRRNKRANSKGSSRSKSPAATGGSSADNNNNNNNYSSSSGCVLPPVPTSSSDVMMTHFPPHHQPNFTSQQQYGSGLSTLNFGGIQVRGNGGSDDDNINNDVELISGYPEQWRHQQFPNFMMNMEATGNNIYSEGGIDRESQIGSKASSSSVKMEGNGNNILNLSGNFLGISNGGDHQNQYWVGGNGWTDQLARFTTSSTRHNNNLL